MDLGTIIGLILCLVAICMSIMSSNVDDIHAFIDIPSLGIVLGGTITAIFVCFPIDQLKTFLAVTRNGMTYTKRDPQHLMELLQDMARRARREGTLSLEEFIDTLEDPFFRNGLQNVADGREPKVIEEILMTEIDKIEERHKAGADMYHTLGMLAPAFGMIGTLIGLVKMLKDMSDPTAIGPSMSIALITTLYGSMIANCFAIPMAKKLEARSKEEIEEKQLIARGILSILARDSVQLIMNKLNARLAPASRVSKEGG
jgi:chemotaxis protein MotA